LITGKVLINLKSKSSRSPGYLFLCIFQW